MTSTNPLGATTVIVGVDTHRDEHVAVAIDCLGARLGQRRLPTAPRGLREPPLLGVRAGRCSCLRDRRYGSLRSRTDKVLGRTWPDCHRGQPARQVYTPQGGNE